MLGVGELLKSKYRNIIIGVIIVFFIFIILLYTYTNPPHPPIEVSYKENSSYTDNTVLDVNINQDSKDFSYAYLRFHLKVNGTFNPITAHICSGIYYDNITACQAAKDEYGSKVQTLHIEGITNQNIRLVFPKVDEPYVLTYSDMGENMPNVNITKISNS